MKNKMAKLFAIGILAATCVVTSCGKESDVTVKYNTPTNNADTENESETAAEDTAVAETEEVSSFDGFLELSKYTFQFASGAGGWSTDFTIDKNGYFYGSYHDSEMGSYGDGYENGTVYYAVFTGRFSEPAKVDEYAYEMTILDISYNDEVGSEEIIDNVKYIYDEAYGLTGTETFLVYFPGTPVDIFSEEVMWWITYSVGDEEVLQTPVIVNVDQEEGIYSYKKESLAEEATEIYDSAKAYYDLAQEELAGSTTTAGMQVMADKSYDIADGCLNDLWDLIKENTEDAEFQAILEEQRAWLKERDAKAEASTEEEQGGSMASVDYALVRAELTMDRCSVLLEYLQ